MKRIFVALVVALVALTQPAAAAALLLGWDQPLDAGGLAVVETYTYELEVDASGPVALVASCVAGAVGLAVCTAPLSAAHARAFETPGSHTAVLTATDSLGSASASHVFVVPVAPTGFRSAAR